MKYVWLHGSGEAVMSAKNLIRNNCEMTSAIIWMEFEAKT